MTLRYQSMESSNSNNQLKLEYLFSLSCCHKAISCRSLYCFCLPLTFLPLHIPCMVLADVVEELDYSEVIVVWIEVQFVLQVFVEEFVIAVHLLSDGLPIYGHLTSKLLGTLEIELVELSLAVLEVGDKFGQSQGLDSLDFVVLISLREKEVTRANLSSISFFDVFVLLGEGEKSLVGD